MKSHQEIIIDKMVEDFKLGTYTELEPFKPFIKWKEHGGTPSFSKAQGWNMRDKAVSMLDELYEKHPHRSSTSCQSVISDNESNNPWFLFAEYEEDKFLVSYLEFIESELCYFHEILN